MSRERKEAKVCCDGTKRVSLDEQYQEEGSKGGLIDLTLASYVVIMMAFGMTKAVIFLSTLRISAKAMTS